jgi:hypothetical protein
MNSAQALPRLSTRRNETESEPLAVSASSCPPRRVDADDVLKLGDRPRWLSPYNRSTKSSTIFEARTFSLFALWYILSFVCRLLSALILPTFPLVDIEPEISHFLFFLPPIFQKRNIPNKRPLHIISFLASCWPSACKDPAQIYIPAYRNKINLPRLRFIFS